MKIVKPVFAIAALSCSLHADIIVTGGWLNNISSAWDGPSPIENDIQSDIPANSLEKTTSTSNSGVTNITTYDYAVSGSTGYFLTSFIGNADAVAGQYGEPHNQGEIDFTVTGAPVTYFITGDFAVSGASAETFGTSLWSGKSDLGETSGGNSNLLTGTLTGVLGVGSYQFAYGATSQTYQGGALSDNGFIRLDFGSPAPAPAPAAVPEPSTFAFMGLGLMGFFMARRTGRRQS